ncbi:hypothetical protein ES705_43102 [subsurface metagenome]
MTGKRSSINVIKLKSLEKTRDFYLWELKRKDSLTERERNKYLAALKVIRGIIKKKEKAEKNVSNALERKRMFATRCKELDIFHKKEKGGSNVTG